MRPALKATLALVLATSVYSPVIAQPAFAPAEPEPTQDGNKSVPGPYLTHDGQALAKDWHGAAKIEWPGILPFPLDADSMSTQGDRISLRHLHGSCDRTTMELDGLSWTSDSDGAVVGVHVDQGRFGGGGLPDLRIRAIDVDRIAANRTIMGLVAQGVSMRLLDGPQPGRATQIERASMDSFDPSSPLLAGGMRSLALKGVSLVNPGAPSANSSVESLVVTMDGKPAQTTLMSAAITGIKSGPLPFSNIGLNATVSMDAQGLDVGVALSGPLAGSLAMRINGTHPSSLDMPKEEWLDARMIPTKVDVTLQAVDKDAAAGVDVRSAATVRMRLAATGLPQSVADDIGQWLLAPSRGLRVVRERVGAVYSWSSHLDDAPAP